MTDAELRICTPILRLEIEPAVAIHTGGEPYEGEYEVTPSREEQVLETAGKYLTQDVTVHPIPPNYGLITYNGYEITVS